MKKAISLLISAAVLTSLFGCIEKGSSSDVTPAPEFSTAEIFKSSNGVLTVIGTGFMENYEDSSHRAEYRDKIVSVVISDGVESVGDNTFADCTALTSVNFADTVSLIGSGSFSRTALSSVTVPASVTSIGSHAFEGCDSMTSLSLSGGLITIGDLAFARCSALTEVTIPASVISVGFEAFYGCSALTSLTISDGVGSIGDQAFAHCFGLTSVTVPASVTSIGNMAFEGCESLTTVIIENSEGAVLIGEGAFPEGCTVTYTI